MIRAEILKDLKKIRDRVKALPDDVTDALSYLDLAADSLEVIPEIKPELLATSADHQRFMAKVRT